MLQIRRGNIIGRNNAVRAEKVDLIDRIHFAAVDEKVRDYPSVRIKVDFPHQLLTCQRDHGDFSGACAKSLWYSDIGSVLGGCDALAFARNARNRKQQAQIAHITDFKIVSNGAVALGHQ